MRKTIRPFTYLDKVKENTKHTKYELFYKIFSDNSKITYVSDNYPGVVIEGEDTRVIVIEIEEDDSSSDRAHLEGSFKIKRKDIISPEYKVQIQLKVINSGFGHSDHDGTSTKHYPDADD